MNAGEVTIGGATNGEVLDSPAPMHLGPSEEAIAIEP